ncbi:hypothetical protein D0501_05850 [Leuconostoc holzapfelii]|uniref:Uncharacterized protein n=1 Tax=Leuconostoc holzapfelii TaxID=434464 RepID=A0ABT2NYY6_9LACO|nr:hypothetical protein [Leuconostoc holzapfelii]MCT8389596.1 hypothetical protein [Leuconostoc holzapfelii]
MDNSIDHKKILIGWSLFEKVSYGCDLFFYIIAGIISVFSYSTSEIIFGAAFLMTILPSLITHLTLIGYLKIFNKEYPKWLKFNYLSCIVLIIAFGLFLVNIGLNFSLSKLFIQSFGFSFTIGLYIIIMSLILSESIAFKMLVHNHQNSIQSYFTE